MPRPLTLDEIAEELLAGDDPSDIILFPPEDGVVTDEDSGDENEANILHLPSRMVRSQVELQNRPSVSGENRIHDLEEEGIEVSAKNNNKYMGGVDRFDENVDSMRVGLRGKKWWFPLFAFGLDAACQNAWLIKRQSENNWTYCDFRRNVTTIYLQTNGKPPTRNSACGVPMQIRVPTEVRSAGSANDHSQIDCSQRRCGLCHQRTRKMCAKCNIGLHLKCWYSF